MKIISIQIFNSIVGDLILGDYEGKLCICDWANRKNRTTIDNRIQKGLNAKYKEISTPLLNETKKQLLEYFDLKITKFSLPIILVGTEFQKKVWMELNNVNFGETLSYQDISNKINSPKSVRAVASAIGANSLSIIVPCHRIISKNGKLTGYAGGLNAKEKLLKLEQEDIKC